MERSKIGGQSNKMAAVAEEEVCAKAQRHQRIGDIYGIAILKKLGGRGVQQDQIVKGPDICTFLRNWHLREITMTLLVRVKCLVGMVNWTEVPGWQLAKHIQGTANKLLLTKDVC